MNSETPTTKNMKESEASFASYLLGFLLSIILTLAAYGAVATNTFSGATLLYWIIALALFQLFVQIIFFLHVGKGKSGKWNSAAFGFAIIIVSIVVGGTLWIMHHLNANMMPRMEASGEAISPQTLRD